MKKAFLLLALSSVVVIGCSPVPSQRYKVSYRVTGDKGLANITCSTPGGGTSQKQAAVPYDGIEEEYKGGEHLYVSAQRTYTRGGRIGSTTVEIVVDGKRKRVATSYGEYTIATANMMAGME